MRQALAARTGLDGRHAFLQATRFCDVSDPEIVCLAESLRRFEQWLARTHPACYLAYLTLPTEPSGRRTAQLPPRPKYSSWVAMQTS